MENSVVTVQNVSTPAKYYPIFKKLQISQLGIIKAILTTDMRWFNSLNKGARLSLRSHKYGFGINRYIENTQFYMCVMEFKQKLAGLWDDYTFDYRRPYTSIERHCIDYTDYFPLYKILVRMCLNEFNLKNKL